ncbi:MBL fold metallo-hydrolase [Bacillus sp. 28A-2]|uniref:MBL fold metallo-hydrolase n=1 Tax=Bacillus sp. 28A-2 TaxID=2772252 RepID=UPI00168CEB5A|nr:MBL fold metallo-hydrolase [Bacillus sp. 28A-2]MBD3858494.1 MBL fold metallo-hydrolase [Bacillus sp. 28A-2]
MRLTTFDRLHQLTLMPRLFPVNCYVFEEEDGLILIDAALKMAANSIIDFARKKNKPIEKIILTHSHMDHIGALDEVKKAFPEAIVYLSKRDARLFAGDFSLLPDEPQQKIKGSFSKDILTKPDMLVEEGDEIGPFKVIATPGHTPGSISLYDERSEVLITGDALVTKGGLSVTGEFRLTFPFPAFATWDAETALKSAKKLLALRLSCLAAGHGDLITGPHAKLQAAIAKREHQLKKRGR